MPHDPIAFLSYVRSDDDHDSGRITELRARLEGEVKMQTGVPFHIFQDRNDIRWGQQWKERIEDALNGVTFLIPIVTPSFFQSHACRHEFTTFLMREKELGENQLILPVYYVRAVQLESSEKAEDEVVTTIKDRNWADWRRFRFEDLSAPLLREAVAKLAGEIVNAMERVSSALQSGQEKPDLTVPIPTSEAETSDDKVTVSLREPEQKFSRPSPAKSREGAATSSKDFSYKIFTTQFDEEISAIDLLDDSSARNLHSTLLGEIRLEVQTSNSLALEVLSETARRSSHSRDVCITILIDNSGSMRGHRTLRVAAWASQISRTLSEASIPNEVLGFTTRAWKGGQSRELWLSEGRKPGPGRLNDLRHIIYKSYDQTFQEADVAFSAMLKDVLLKENIDGEAILWAKARIDERKERRKILLVISDGAPVDDSTLASNPADYLSKHLSQVIRGVREENAIEIYGAGLEADIQQYYGPSPRLDLKHFGQDFVRVVTHCISKDWPAAASIQRLPESKKKGKRKVKDSTE